MISKDKIDIIIILVEKLQGLKFIIVGSSSLALQGVDIIANDIDLLVDYDDLDKAKNILREYVFESIVYTKNNSYKSYFGKLKIKNFEVDIIANIEVFKDGSWHEYKFRSNKIVLFDYKGIKIPLLSLQDQYETYSRINRDKDKITLMKIREFMTSKY